MRGQFVIVKRTEDGPVYGRIVDGELIAWADDPADASRVTFDAGNALIATRKGAYLSKMPKGASVKKNPSGRFIVEFTAMGNKVTVHQYRTNAESEKEALEKFWQFADKEYGARVGTVVIESVFGPRAKNPAKRVMLSNGVEYNAILVVLGNAGETGRGWELFWGDPHRLGGTGMGISGKVYRTRAAAIADGLRMFGERAITEAQWKKMVAARGENPAPSRRAAQEALDDIARDPQIARGVAKFAKKRAKKKAARKRNPATGYVIHAQRGSGPLMHFNGTKFTNNGRPHIFAFQSEAARTARKILDTHPILRPYRVTVEPYRPK